MATEPGRVLAAEGYSRRRRQCLAAGQLDGFFLGLGSVKIAAGSTAIYTSESGTQGLRTGMDDMGGHIRCGS